MHKAVCQSAFLSRARACACWAVLAAILALVGPTTAHGQVVFKDANLKAAVVARLGVVDPTPADMLRLSSLYAVSLGIADLTGLEYAANLTFVDAQDNQIVDISPLAELNGLTHLFLSNNQIADISACAGLANLTLLDLENNQVTSLAPLTGLTRMTHLYLLGNPLDRTAYCQDLQAMEAGNPGITLAFSPNANPPGGVSASDGTYADRIRVMWEPLCAGPSVVTFMYRVSRSTSLEGDKQAVSEWSAETSFDDTSLAPCVHYYYWVESRISKAFSLPDEGWPVEPNVILTVSSGGHGSAAGSGDYECGSTVSIAAVPDVDYHFVNWTASGTVTVADAASANTTVTVNGDAAVTAVFAENTDLQVDTLRVLEGNVTSGSAVLRGRITGDWRQSNCVFYFGVFKKTSGSPQGLYTEERTVKTVEGQADFTQVLKGLEPECTYVYRAYASNAYESAEGETMEFTTKPLSPLDVLYVDDDAINDPGPHDVAVSDPQEDGSQAHPFDSIQKAIDAAREHVKVLVSDGRYTECLDFRGKHLDVNGFELSNQAQTALPIIDAMDQGVVVTFDQGEGAECRLSGFVLTRGLGDRAGAIECVGSSPTIQHCLIVGNRCAETQTSLESPRGAIYCEDSDSLFENCTIADNYGGKDGSGICMTNCNIVLSHAIVWGNAPAQIRVVSGKAPVVVTSCTDEDPLFALPGYWTDAQDVTLGAVEPGDPGAIWLEGDYHVRSLHGRYDRFAGDWAFDDVTSDCIDLGDVSRSTGHETAPHGDRVNAGAYGGSWMASRTGKFVFVAISDPNFSGRMSKYEVTNAQYCQYLNAALAHGSIVVSDNRVYDASDTSRSQLYFKAAAASSYSQIIHVEGAFEVRARDGLNMSNHPVVDVSWYGATAFAAAHGFRLPTSMEWQAVADYDGSYAYGCGTIIDPNRANFDTANPMGLSKPPYTSPVGYYPSFGYGLCDLAGNVWEWTSSKTGRFNLLHGGGWRDVDVFCTVASQSGYNPGYALPSVGFRVCR